MTLTPEMQARKDVILRKHTTLSFGFCTNHRRTAIIKDEMGRLWCEDCRIRHDVTNWGKSHDWPFIYAYADDGTCYAIAEGYFFWEAAILLGKKKALTILYESLTKVEAQDA